MNWKLLNWYEFCFSGVFSYIIWTLRKLSTFWNNFLPWIQTAGIFLWEIIVTILRIFLSSRCVKIQLLAFCFSGCVKYQDFIRVLRLKHSPLSENVSKQTTPAFFIIYFFFFIFLLDVVLRLMIIKVVYNKRANCTKKY